MDLKGKKVAILGFGIEGKDLLSYLLSKKAEVTVLDRKNKKDINLAELDTAKVELVTGEDYLKELSSFEIIFRSPGVYRFLPEILEAENKGIQISSAVKLFFDLCPGMIIGVTGTKGKGTTASLIYEILKKSGKDVYLAGNIGKPYLELIDILNKESIVVLELSSFQLIDLDKSPQVAVVLNITQDHLDWHKNVGEYLDAKKNIVKHQKPSGWAIINEEYEVPKSFAQETKSQIIFFSKEKLEEKYKKDLLLKGEHNLENVAAAVSVAKNLGISEEVILSSVKEFKGLEHRLEFVKEVNGISFYNDSFATGPQPTIAAIKSFSEPETIILGGSEKGLSYDILGEVAAGQKNLKTVILIGAIREKIRKSLISASFGGTIVDLDSKPMNEIVERAYKLTPKGGVVLLSPAAASFDMFSNYKERGKSFKEAVSILR